MKNSHKTLNIFTLNFAFLLISGCATQQPVLYPNSYYNHVGKKVADEDINYCLDLATGSGAMPDKSKQILARTAEGSLIGGATGAATGAIYGNAAKGAASGAAGGGVFGMTRALLNTGEPNHVFKGFVNRCLRDKGYDPIGWS